MFDGQCLDTGSVTSRMPDRAQCLPLTSMQQAMIFDELALGAPDVNYLQVPITLTGEVERSDFVTALTAELALQPAARTRLQAEQAIAGAFGGQQLSATLPDPVALQRAFKQAPAFGADRLVAVSAITDPNVIWLTCHHAVADRPGVEALIRRAARRYLGQSNPSPGSYADAIAAINRAQWTAAPPRPTTVSPATALRDGMTLAADAPLVPDTPPPGHAVRRLRQTLPRSDWSALCRLARGIQISEQQVIAAMTQAALSRCRGLDSGLLGIPVSLRDGLDDPELLGCFIGTVGISIPATVQGTCQAYLKHWRDRFLDCYEQRWLPAIGREQNFAMLFAWHDLCTADLGTGQVNLGIAAPYPGRTPLSLAAQPDAGALLLALDYDPARIDAEAAKALLDLLVTALARLAQAETGTALSLDAAFAQTRPVESCEEPGVPAYFAVLADHARRQPGAAAITGSDGHGVSYGELAHGMACVAAWAATTPSGVIGLCMRRDPTIIVALLGLLKSGRTVALLDAEAGPAALKSASAGLAVICGLATDVSDLPGGVAVAQLLARAAPDPDRDQSNTAGVVIYTSGSTGAARPVLLGFDTIARHAAWAEQAFGLTPADRVLQFCAMAFDAMLEELLPTLRAGATVVLRDTAAAQGGVALLQFCAARQVTVADLPTGFFNLAAFDLDNATWPPSLRLLVIGGEAYRSEAVQRWLALAGPGQVRICTSYGPTEATIIVTFQELKASDPSGLLGAARPGTGLLILDRHGRPAPLGCIGELFLTGSALAHGYLGCPADTADRFVPNPYAAAGAVMYRTGDHVREHPGGQISFVGRTDRQVKLGGRRFEVERVEQQLARIAGVPVLVHIPQQAGAKPYLWVGVPTDPVIAAKLARVVEAMPAWHRPAQTRYGVLPLTPRGKVDRRAAAALLEADCSAAAPLAATADSAPLALIREILGQAAAGAADDFLQLGGTSLTVLQLVALVRLRLNKQVAVSTLYADTGIAAMSQAIERAPQAEAEPGQTRQAGGDAPGGDCTGAGPWPVSPYETALYLDTQRRGDDQAYRITASWRVAAVLDPQQFANAAAEVLTRHPLLTAHIGEQDGVLHWHPIRPQTEPPTRIELLQEPGAGSSTIQLETSHLTCDDAAITLILSDLARAYDSTDESLGDSLGARSVPPQPEHRPDLLDTWRVRLAGSFATALPGSNAPAGPLVDLAKATAAIETAPFCVGPMVVGHSAASSITPFVLSLAPVCTWLARACADRGATVWTPVRLEPAAGVRLAMTTLPLTVQTPPEANLLSLCDAVQQELGGALDHRHMDTAQLAGMMRRGQPGLGGLAILFDLTDERTAAAPRFDGQPALPAAQPITSVRADIEIAATISADGLLSYRMRGRAELYDRATLDGWTQSLASFAARLLEQPDLPQACWPLCVTATGKTAGGYRGSLLHRAENSGSTASAPLPARLRSALQSQSASCVITADQRFDGTEIVALADRLAAELTALGAEPGHSVELILPRCAVYPAALLAIWTIGAVPILINPALPAAAQAAMQAVAGAGYRIHAAIGTPWPLVAQTTIASTACVTKDAAYGAFTSGTTGTPKLVVVTWQGLDALLGWARDALPMTSGNRFLHLATPGFDIALFEMLHPLLSGAGLLIAGEASDLNDLARFAERERATHLHFVPALLGAFLDIAPPELLGLVKLVMCGGDTVPVDLARRVLALGIGFQHCYGPTETTIFVASASIRQDDCAKDFLLLGEPVSGSGLAVCDRFGHVLPRGLPGELIVFGESLAAGYYRDARTTADRFEPSELPGERTYRTGDRALIGTTGAVRHLGRIDRQLKISGVRFEPAAIEAALERHPEVTRAAVFAIERGGSAALVAVVRPITEQSSTPADLPQRLRDHVAARFHAAAVPNRILIANALPTTANGKLDYAALRQLAAQAHAQEQSETSEPDRSAEEPRLRILLDIWSEILDQPVRSGTDFFAAGGDSMSAIRMVARAARAGLAFSIADIFRHPTPQRLIALADERSEIRSPESTARPDTPAPLAPAARDWLARTAEFAEQDVLAIAVTLPSGTGPVELTDALAALIEHHDALRLCISRDGAAWQCRFAAAYRPDCPGAVSQSTGLTLALAAVRPEHGRMLGAAWRAGATPHAILAVHHLAIDPSGWDTLVHDLLQVLATGGAHRFRVPPFSSSCGGRDPGLARVAQNIAAGPRAARVTVALPGAKISQAALLRAVAGALESETVDRPAVIAAERPGRTSDETGIVGWFTQFEHWPSPAASSSGTSGSGFADSDITVVVSIAAQPPAVAAWEVLQADIAPVHPLAIELGETTSGWALTLVSDATWTADALERIGTAVAARLVEPDAPAAIPALPLQLAMVMASAAGRSRTAYHTQIVFEPVGVFDPELLIQAWQDAHAAHDALRLCFTLEEADFQPTFAIMPVSAAASMPVTRSDCSSQPAADLLAEFLAQDLQLGFVAGKPLSRIALLKGQDGWRLVWSHHHAVLDGWSLNLVTQTVAACYVARSQGAPLPPPAPSIRPLAEWWQRQSRPELDLAAQALISSWPRGFQAQTGTARGAVITSSLTRLDAVTTAALRDLARQARVTLFELCLAACGIVDAQRKGDSAGMFRFIASLRSDEVPEIDRTVGLCMNVLPLRFAISRSLTDLLAQVRASLTRTMEIAAASPFGVARALREAGLDQRFDTLVVFENYPGDRSGVPLGEAGFLHVRAAREEGEARFTLVILPDLELAFELLHSDDTQSCIEAQTMLTALTKVLHHFAKPGLSAAGENQTGA